MIRVLLPHIERVAVPQTDNDKEVAYGV